MLTLTVVLAYVSVIGLAVGLLGSLVLFVLFLCGVE